VGLGAETAFSPPPILILRVPHGKGKTGPYPLLNLKLMVYLYRVSPINLLLTIFLTHINCLVDHMKPLQNSGITCILGK
jgi:hypothetical protein